MFIFSFTHPCVKKKNSFRDVRAQRNLFYIMIEEKKSVIAVVICWDPVSFTIASIKKGATQLPNVICESSHLEKKGLKIFIVTKNFNNKNLFLKRIKTIKDDRRWWNRKCLFSLQFFNPFKKEGLKKKQ